MCAGSGGGRVGDALGAGAAQHGQRDPLPDHRDVAGTEDRPRGRLEPGEVPGEERGVVPSIAEVSGIVTDTAAEAPTIARVEAAGVRVIRD